MVEHANDPGWIRPMLPVFLDGDEFGHVRFVHAIPYSYQMMRLMNADPIKKIQSILMR
jgi:hypothetical protein